MAQVPDIDVSTISVGGSAYTVPFVYQNRAEVFVEVDGVSTTFTWINDGNISITPAPAAGAVVRRYRSTSALELRHDYRNGVPFTPKNIAENNDQLLFVIQEATSTAADAEATANGIAATAAAAVATANAADTKAQLALDTVEASGVNSFNTRTGAVYPQAGDYTAELVTYGAGSVEDALDALRNTVGTTGVVQTSGATGSAKLPAGTTAERDASPALGFTRINSTLSTMEWWTGTVWHALGGDVTGPADSAPYELPCFQNTAGKLLQRSGVYASSGDLRASNMQVGQAGASNNFHIRNPADGTLAISRGNLGTPIADVMRVKANNSVEFPGGVASGVFGTEQTLQSVVRVSGTTYTNTTGKAILAMLNINNYGTTTLTVVVGGLTIVNKSMTTAVTAHTECFVVPIGATYSITASAVATFSVSEFR